MHARACLHSHSLAPLDNNLARTASYDTIKHEPPLILIIHRIIDWNFHSTYATEAIDFAVPAKPARAVPAVNLSRWMAECKQTLDQ